MGKTGCSGFPLNGVEMPLDTERLRPWLAAKATWWHDSKKGGPQ